MVKSPDRPFFYYTYVAYSSRICRVSKTHVLLRVSTALRLDAPIALANRYLPLFDMNLGWMLPALVGLVIGFVIHLSRRKTTVTAQGEDSLEQ